MANLKPCPFCGGKVRTFGGYLWHVVCDACGCKLTGFATEAEAIAAWNTRVYPGDETAEYFILPKPKEKIANEYSAIKCDANGVSYATFGLELINDALNRWQDQIDAEIKKKLFEAFRPVCTIEERYTANNRHEVGREFVKLSCGHYVERHSTFCSYCGARVVENGKA